MDGNLLYYGDNLDVLRRHIKDETVDLVYLDPPFNSNTSYNVLFAEQAGTPSHAQITAFEDTWRWDTAAAHDYQRTVEEGGPVADALLAFHTLLGPSNMLAYLAMMAPRLVELQRVMKATASIYLHCDATASHYLKLLMDAVFGPRNFRNELIWHYGGRGAKAIAEQFPRNHDVILLYSRSAGSQVYHRQYIRKVYSTAEARASGFRQGDDGRWFKTAPRGDYTDESIERLREEGRVHVTRTGSIRVKYFLETEGGSVVEQVLVGDTWLDIPDAMHIGKERLGYPTQKPQALLERILNASTVEGDTLLDPFCGCGTSIAAAQKLERRWIGIDITHLAIGLIKHRLADTYGPGIASSYRVIGEPTDVEGAQELAATDPWQFQAWALGLVGARVATSAKKGGDKGIDGRLNFHDDESGETKRIIFSVKGGHLVPAFVRDLRGVVDREKAQIGVLLTFEKPSAGMRAEAAEAGFYTSPWGATFPRIQLLTVGQLLDGKQVEYPNLTGGNVTHRRAPRELVAADQGELAYGDG